MKREWLIQIRKDSNCTQEQIASEAFIDRGYYSQIETGKRNPSLAVAFTIAKILKFDPLLFFQDHLDQISSQDKAVNHKIRNFFKVMEKGEILYLYKSMDNYIHHLVTFILLGIERRSLCIIIDYKKNLERMKEVLEGTVNKNEWKDYVLFINKTDIIDREPNEIIDKFQIVQQEFVHIQSIRIWLSEEEYVQDDWLNKLDGSLQTKAIELDQLNTLFVRSYNAMMISAEAHIKMMRQYPHFMTDEEIVDSPLYNDKYRLFIFPSIFMQEEM